MARRQPAFTRQGGKYAQNPTILLLCEDSESSRVYFEDAIRHNHAQVRVSVAHGKNTDPLGIVNEGIKKLKEFETVYCVIDRDTHHNFDDAVQKAAANSRVKLIVSYPCFEYWLLLHFIYTRKPYMRVGDSSPADCVASDLRRQADMAEYEKGSADQLFSGLLPRLSTAIEHAGRANREAVNDGEKNPSTDIPTLFDLFSKLSEPIPV